MSNLSIRNTELFFNFRNYLQQLSSVTYLFTKINQSYPSHTLDDVTAEEVMQLYVRCIQDGEKIIKECKEKVISQLNEHETNEERI